MWKVRVLVGGNIYVIRATDRVGQQYSPTGEAINSHNILDLEPWQVIKLAQDAEHKWLYNE